MTLRIGEVAPNFSARSTHGAFRFYSWMDGNWVVLLAYPRTITPASAKEVRTIERLQPAFERLRCKIIGLAIWPVEDLDDWLADIAEASGLAPSYPLIGSPDLQVAKLFDMIRDGDGRAQTMRRMIVIGPDRRVKLSVAYPMVTDAIFDEILQMIGALQTGTPDNGGRAVGSAAGDAATPGDAGTDAAEPDDIRAGRANCGKG